MSRVPRRYAIHLILSGGHEEVVHFPTLEAFQQWYTSEQQPKPSSMCRLANWKVSIYWFGLEA
jgi:hypothetical protein